MFASAKCWKETHPWSKSSGFCGVPKNDPSNPIPQNSKQLELHCSVGPLPSDSAAHPKHHHGEWAVNETNWFQGNVGNIWKYHCCLATRYPGSTHHLREYREGYTLSHYLQGFSTMAGAWPWDFWSVNSMFISTFQGVPIKSQQMVFRNHLAPELEGPGFYPEIA